MNTRAQIRLAACVAALIASAPTATLAQTSTVEILNQTIVALPSCLKYELRGVCFWLYCSWGCRIRQSVKIRHYVPDVIVSTYNDPAQHPWTEVGRPIAGMLSSVGGSLMGGVLDASANTDRTGREEVTFKSVDVIGNPVGMLAQMLSGSSPGFPSTFTVPSVTELATFPTQLPTIAREWASVPAQAGNEVLAGARQAVAAPAAMLSKMNSVMSAGQRLAGGSFSPSSIGLNTERFTTLDTGPLERVSDLISMAGGSDSLLCPGSASAFGLHYQSDLDAPFWRGLVPLEMLYASSWVPGLKEVTTGSGLVSTWGNEYPRTGELAQVHPVKASAVLATRARSIVTKASQPHIYTRMKAGGSVRYFESMGSPRWQMVYPMPSTSCVEFGTNDSASLIGFGDNKTAANAGYVWNLWHRYECCRKRGAYLFSVP